MIQIALRQFCVHFISFYSQKGQVYYGYFDIYLKGVFAQSFSPINFYIRMFYIKICNCIAIVIALQLCKLNNYVDLYELCKLNNYVDLYKIMQTKELYKLKNYVD